MTKKMLLTGLTVAVVILSSATAVAQRRRGPELPPLTEEEKQDAVRALDCLIEEVKREKTIATSQVDRALATLSQAGQAEGVSLPWDQIDQRVSPSVLMIVTGG